MFRSRKQSKYIKTLRSYRKNLFLGILNNLNLYQKFLNYKNNLKIKNNIAPDISSITENIAFIIDDEVVEIIHCQPKMAAILLSNPKIILIPENVFVRPGYKYIEEKFRP